MKRILVVGDVMIDADVHFEQTRTAPEGCPVLVERRRSHRPGGAAAVAAMAAALGDAVMVAGVAGGIGALTLIKMLADAGVSPMGLIDGGVTTDKTRHYVDGVLRARIDRDASVRMNDSLVKLLNERIPQSGAFDVVLVADHGKGFVSPPLWAWLVERFRDIPILVDPARGGKGPGDYLGAAAIVANRAEAGYPPDKTVAAWRCGQWLSLFPKLQAAVIKLDRDGFAFADRDEGGYVAPSQANRLVDPVGAGDAFLAAMGHAIAEGQSWKAAASFGNAAAAVCCGKAGAVPVTLDEIAEHGQRVAAIRA